MGRVKNERRFGAGWKCRNVTAKAATKSTNYDLLLQTEKKKIERNLTEQKKKPFWMWIFQFGYLRLDSVWIASINLKFRFEFSIFGRNLILLFSRHSTICESSILC